MTPRTEGSLYQPAISVSRIEERMAATILSRRGSPLRFWNGVPGSSNISTKSFRERSVRFRSRQSARRNITSGRRGCSSFREPFPETEGIMAFLFCCGRARQVPSYGIDRKSVVQGKSVDLGGRRIIKKKKKRRQSGRRK